MKNVMKKIPVELVREMRREMEAEKIATTEEVGARAVHFNIRNQGRKELIFHAHSYARDSTSESMQPPGGTMPAHSPPGCSTLDVGRWTLDVGRS